MKHLKIHRILKEDKLDEYGNIYSTQFYIKERVSVLGIKYWKSIKRTTGDYGGYTDIIRYFDTIEEAQEYRKKLCKKQSLTKAQPWPSEEDRATLIKFLEWYLDDGITVYDESEEAVDEFFKQSLQD